MFLGIRKSLRKAEAAASVQTLLETHGGLGDARSKAQSIANRTVEVYCTENAEAFGTHSRRLPNKLALAAASLAYAIEKSRSRAIDDYPLSLCLAVAMNDLGVRSGKMGEILNQEKGLPEDDRVDHFCLTYALHILDQQLEKHGESELGRELDAVFSKL